MEQKPPIFLKTVNFNDEKAISQTLLEFEKEAVYEKIETACIILSLTVVHIKTLQKY